MLSTTTGPITEELIETLRGLLTNDDFGELSEEQVTPAAVSHLSDERYLESFVGGEVSKKEYFLFHNLPWPPAAKTGLPAQVENLTITGPTKDGRNITLRKIEKFKLG